VSCLIVFRSITYAQNAQGLFAKNGILATIMRPPLKLGKGSCSYALKLDGKYLKKACDLLLQTRIKIIGLYKTGGDGQYQEVGYDLL